MQDETSVMHWYLSQKCVLADIALLTDIKHDEVYWCLWLMFIGSTTWLLLSLNFQSSLDDELKYIKAGHILWWRFLVLKNKITEQATEISFLWRVAGLFCGDRLGRYSSGSKVASWEGWLHLGASWEVFQNEAPGQIQDMLERWNLSAGLGTPHWHIQPIGSYPHMNYFYNTYNMAMGPNSRFTQSRTLFHKGSTINLAMNLAMMLNCSSSAVKMGISDLTPNTVHHTHITARVFSACQR